MFGLTFSWCFLGLLWERPLYPNHPPLYWTFARPGSPNYDPWSQILNLHLVIIFSWKKNVNHSIKIYGYTSHTAERWQSREKKQAKFAFYQIHSSCTHYPQVLLRSLWLCFPFIYSSLQRETKTLNTLLLELTSPGLLWSEYINLALPLQTYRRLGSWNHSKQNLQY